MALIITFTFTPMKANARRGMGSWAAFRPVGKMVLSGRAHLWRRCPFLTSFPDGFLFSIKHFIPTGGVEEQLKRQLLVLAAHILQ